MKIALAQTRPIKGDLQRNLDNHVRLLNLAVNHSAKAIFFPELSLTGYEPELAKDLAIDIDNDKLNILQNGSDDHDIIIGAGMPTKQHNGTAISMIILQPHQARQLYSKKYLHADEEPFFVSGENTSCLISYNISLAICYEISIAEHAENAYDSGAKIYLASVAKTAEGMAKANVTLPAMAKEHNMIVLLSNCVGPSDNFISAGQSAAWNDAGHLMGRLDDSNEGLLIVDTEIKQCIQLKF